VVAVASEEEMASVVDAVVPKSGTPEANVAGAAVVAAARRTVVAAACVAGLAATTVAPVAVRVGSESPPQPTNAATAKASTVVLNTLNLNIMMKPP
jgi:hypothetical protein